VNLWTEDAVEEIFVVDTHTGGEPTRVVYGGGPDLGQGDLAQRRARFQQQFDQFRRAIVCEPRGSEVWVGALLVPPVDSTCVTGVIFFNNVGYLGMCGHGTIGVVVALARLGRIDPGSHRIETPVGVVPFEFDGSNTVTLENVPSYRQRSRVSLEVPGFGQVYGDVAWGGNWFFLVHHPQADLGLRSVDQLTQFCWAIRRSLAAHGVTGTDRAEIDHIELCGPPLDPQNHGRNFVLCPGGAYDRSPCGTGTSAKIACLAAEDDWPAGKIWRQESVLGSLFEAWYRQPQKPDSGHIHPVIRGTAHVCAESTLLLAPADPFCWGIG